MYGGLEKSDSEISYDGYTSSDVDEDIGFSGGNMIHSNSPKHDVSHSPKSNNSILDSLKSKNSNFSKSSKLDALDSPKSSNSKNSNFSKSSKLDVLDSPKHNVSISPKSKNSNFSNILDSPKPDNLDSPKSKNSNNSNFSNILDSPKPDVLDSPKSKNSNFSNLSVLSKLNIKKIGGSKENIETTMKNFINDMKEFHL
jgi:hypothetical protein